MKSRITSGPHSEPASPPADSSLSPKTLHHLYRLLLTPRLVEERMLLLLRQGKLSKWFSGIGQEAISVGITAALEPSDRIFTLHRNLGVFTSRGVPLWRLFRQFQGDEGGFTKGRDRSFHFGTQEHNIVGMISHLGPQLAVATGAALAEKLRGMPGIAAVFTGEGGTSQGDFHEALNLASVWDLPVLFVIENNGYALSTPTAQQYRCESLAERAHGYGIEGVTVDGNNLLAVYQQVDKLVAEMRKNPRPVLLECMTFRMRGHEEASGVAYVPPELFVEWKKYDPISQFEEELRTRGIADEVMKSIRDEITQHIDEQIEIGFTPTPLAVISEEHELSDVFAPSEQPPTPPTQPPVQRRFIDAVSAGLREAMHRDERIILMGQDIAEYGGAFKITKGFLEEFGRDRVRNTPLCESAVLGAALGLSIAGYRAVVEMQFADFVSSGFTQVVNNLAKTHYRWGEPVRVVVRLPCGGGTAAGPFHSQTPEGWFTQTAGLKVVYPSNPFDAKGLLLASLAEPNPVMFFEHKALYRRIEGPVPDGYYTLPLGVAARVSEGADATVITYGAGVHWALDWSVRNPEHRITILDLRTLVPLDYESIAAAVKLSGRVVVLHEASLFSGFGGEIAAWIGEHCFSMLDAPVMRCGSLDTPVPFAPALEKIYLPVGRFDRVMEDVLGF